MLQCKNKQKLTEPSLKEDRPKWEDVPINIVSKIEEILDAKIIDARTGWGGFSNTAVFIVELSTGNKAFIKGTHPGQDAHGTQMVLQELEAYKKIKPLKNISPKILGTVNDKDEDGWSLIICEYKNTKQVEKFDLELIKNIFSKLKETHSLPPQENILHANETNYIERYFREEGGWLRINSEERIYKKLLKVFSDKEEGDSFLKKALPKLSQKQKEFLNLKTKEGALHQDLRIDNLLITKADEVFVIDWPNYCYGPVVLDLAMLLPSLSYCSDYSITEMLEIYNQITELNISEGDLVLAITVFSGFIADSAYRKIPEKLPRLRWMQKAILLESLEYLSAKLDLPKLPEFIDS